MRFGLNTFLTSSGFTDADIPLIQEFKAYGAEAVELAIAEPSAVTATKVVDAMNAAGLERPVICGAFGPGRDLRGSAEARERCMAYVTELIELGEKTGATLVCGPMYSETGRAGRHTPEEREAQLERIADSLKPLCKLAEAAGIALAMEPLNRFETDCINTLEQAIRMIERVGSPALKIHIDTFHMNIEEEDSAAAIRSAAGHIAHVHASASHRGLLGRDQVDWPGVLGALHQIGYDGDMIIESFSMDNAVIARAAAIWRPLFDSPEQLAVEGLRFLRKNWKQSLPNSGQSVTPA